MAGPTSRSILISGAGIAGPTLAYWLLQRGFRPVLLERAPRFREGGYVIDFWGVGIDVAERMGLLPRLREIGYLNDRITFVRPNGGTRSTFGGAPLRRTLGDRLVTIQRGDLAHAIYDMIEGQVETIFGDSVQAIEQRPDGVNVAFAHGSPRSFDLVIGADGLHSAVRRAIFADAHSEHYLGYYAAVFVTKGYSKRDEHAYVSYASPGRQISRFALREDRTGFFFVFARPQRFPEGPFPLAAQKQALVDEFDGEPWIEWPEIKRHLAACDNMYFDAVSQIELPAWSLGRAALVGDAAYCPSLLAGEGSAFAMAGAYILAGELQQADGDPAAFAAYERRFRPFIERKQKSARAFASSFAPKTRRGLFVRDLVLRVGAIPAVADHLMRRFVLDHFDLPEYAPCTADAR
jgi:2-polyprenyl-6-methoxyphenol hydroxylase-like FAD-dependent oxidoreductase